MIERSPVPATRPECFGTGYEPTDITCRGCRVRRTCSAQRDRWATHRSLAEVAANPPPEPLDSAPDEPEACYAAIYQKHYGYDPFAVRNPRQKKAAAKARQFVAKGAALCKAHDLDFALFITAQMHAFRVSQQNGYVTHLKNFPTNWLSGPGAVKRYHVHGARAQRQFRRVRADAFDHHTAWGHLRTRLVDDEEDVAALYCTGVRLADDDAWTYATAADEADPTLDWWAVTTLGSATATDIRSHYWTLHKQFGAETLAGLKQHARHRAAFALAEQTQHGLADRLHLHDDWTWEDFAALLLRVGGPLRRTRPTHTPDGMQRFGGRLWGARS